MEDQKCGEVTYTFSAALDLLKSGHGMARDGWHGKAMYLLLQTPTELSKMTKPYIYITVPNGEKKDLVPWIASQTDLLSDDWYIVL